MYSWLVTNHRTRAGAAGLPDAWRGRCAGCKQVLPSLGQRRDPSGGAASATHDRVMSALWSENNHHIMRCVVMSSCNVDLMWSEARVRCSRVGARDSRVLL